MQKTQLISRVVVIAAFCVLPFSARAAVVYNSGTADFADGGGAVIGGSNLFVEQFTLSGTETVADVQVGLSLYTFDPSWDGSLTYFLYDDDGGSPSTLIQQGTNPSFNLNSLGEPYPDTGSYDYNYQFDLSTPVTLGAGTYWLGVQTTTSSDLTWLDVNQSQINAATDVDGTFYAVEETLSLEVSDTPLVAPEPATGSMMLLAGIGLATMRLRKGKTRA